MSTVRGMLEHLMNSIVDLHFRCAGDGDELRVLVRFVVTGPRDFPVLRTALLSDRSLAPSWRRQTLSQRRKCKNLLRLRTPIRSLRTTKDSDNGRHRLFLGIRSYFPIASQDRPMPLRWNKLPQRCLHISGRQIRTVTLLYRPNRQTRFQVRRSSLKDHQRRPMLRPRTE